MKLKNLIALLLCLSLLLALPFAAQAERGPARPVSEPAAPPEAGSASAVSGPVKAEAAGTEELTVTFTLSAQTVTNGRFRFSWPEELTLKSLTGELPPEAGICDVNRADGSLTFAWATAELPQADTLLLTLVFTGQTGSYTAELATLEPENEAAELSLELGHDCPCAFFEDMPEYGTIEHAAIDWAYTHDPQITDGMTETTFEPCFTVNRGQAVTFLWRAAGKPAVTGANPFVDLTQDWYREPVQWAFTNGITDGTSDTTFEPDTSLNRGMMITFLYRQQGAPAYAGEDHFADSDVPVWFKDAMNWAVENGIITADTVWSEDCPRVDVVVYLFRVLEPEAAVAFN